MRTVFSVLAAALVLVACSDSPAEPPAPLSGEWTGSADGAAVALVVVESGGSITGSGTLTSGFAVIPLTVTGTYVHPTVTMSWTSEGYPSTNFKGTRAGGAGGTVNGSLSGLVVGPLVLTKQ